MAIQLSTERVADLYSWATAWRSTDPDGGTDLSGLRASNRAEFEAWRAAHDAEVWDAGVMAAFAGVIMRQNADDVKHANPYRTVPTTIEVTPAIAPGQPPAPTPRLKITSLVGGGHEIRVKQSEIDGLTMSELTAAICTLRIGGRRIGPNDLSPAIEKQHPHRWVIPITNGDME